MFIFFCFNVIVILYYNPLMFKCQVHLKLILTIDIGNSQAEPCLDFIDRGCALARTSARLAVAKSTSAATMQNLAPYQVAAARREIVRVAV